MLEPCWAREFLNIACPACGMTRSFLRLVDGDFLGSLQYNPLLILAIIWGFLVIYNKHDSRKKTWLLKSGILLIMGDWIYCLIIYA